MCSIVGSQNRNNLEMSKGKMKTCTDLVIFAGPTASATCCWLKGTWRKTTNKLVEGVLRDSSEHPPPGKRGFLWRPLGPVELYGFVSEWDTPRMARPNGSDTAKSCRPCVESDSTTHWGYSRGKKKQLQVS